MMIHIAPTSRTVELVTEHGPVPARIWEGETDGGLPVICWVTRVAAKRDDDLSELETALAEQRPPSAEAQEFPLRMIL
jgi:hypothetical protein